MNANEFWQKKINLVQANDMGFYSRAEYINKAVDLITEFFHPDFCPIEALKEFSEVFFKISSEEINL